MRLLAAALTALVLPAQTPAPVRFEDVTSKSRIDFTLRNCATPQKNLIETMTGGVAVLDYDNDGRPDVYFVNGAAIPALEKTDESYWNRLWRSNGDGTFPDVTRRAGVPGSGYAMGAAAGDYDNDGDTDLFVAGVNRNLLYRNRGDGTFEDVTRAAGLAAAGTGRQPWSVAAGWLDYDNDGLLDLFVVNYVDWSPEKEVFCGDKAKGFRTYCHPRLYGPLPNALYRNRGDGTFADVSAAAGIAAAAGKGMGVAFGDYDQDGDLDIFVTNDTLPNFLFRNEAGKRFREEALYSGVAFNDDGRAVSSMGADFRDLDNDGRDDILVTALANERFPLFLNLGKGLFRDATHSSLLGRMSLDKSGWGVGLFDLNNDGSKDIFVANGDVQNNSELFSSRKSKQANTIFLNRGDGTFTDGAAQAGPALAVRAQHRGAAFGDLDQDGRIDVVISALEGKAQVLRNVSATGHHWLGLRLAGSRGNRDGIGARVRIVSGSGAVQYNHVTTAVGYSSSSDKAVHFGLGKDAAVKLLEIRWPSGTVQQMENVAVDRYLAVREP